MNPLDLLPKAKPTRTTAKEKSNTPASIVKESTNTLLIVPSKLILSTLFSSKVATTSNSDIIILSSLKKPYKVEFRVEIYYDLVEISRFTIISNINNIFEYLEFSKLSIVTS